MRGLLIFWIVCIPNDLEIKVSKTLFCQLHALTFVLKLTMRAEWVPIVFSSRIYIRSLQSQLWYSRVYTCYMYMEHRDRCSLITSGWWQFDWSLHVGRFMFPIIVTCGAGTDNHSVEPDFTLNVDPCGTHIKFCFCWRWLHFFWYYLIVSPF